MKINSQGKLTSLIALVVLALFAINCNNSANNVSGGKDNLSGKWDLVCCDGKYTGKVTLVQEGDKITGTYDDASQIEGEIKGNTVTLRRRWATGAQDYTLEVSPDGKTLTGTFSGTRDASVGV